MNVLIIEDNDEVVVTVSLAFRIRWPWVKIMTTASGEEGILLAETDSPSVIILDLSLPDISGFEVLKSIRRFSKVPIVILTVMSEEKDIIRGLESGADEYIVKPFGQLELVARVNALLRRRGDMPEGEITCGLLKLNAADHILHFGCEEIILTRIEATILQQLMQNTEQTVSRTNLSEHIWGDSYPDTIKNLESHIEKLREKVEPDPGDPKIIKTEAESGYILIKPE